MAMNVAYTIPRFQFDREPAYSGQPKQYVLRVRDMPSDDKPREKMLKNGPSSLTTNELLAVVLSTNFYQEG